MKYIKTLTSTIILPICLLISFISCQKEPVPPSLTTSGVSEISYLSAITGGNISDDGGSEITSRGVCWSTAQSPTTADGKTEDGSGSGAFTSVISGLSPETVYYVRSYAANSAGISYGNEITFTSGPLTDVDGNTYNTVTIGNQVWMAENLKVTKLNDGTPIQLLSEDTDWSSTRAPAYTWYDNNESMYGQAYGAIYNWYAVNTNILCPTGWHVPGDEEWTTLTDFLGGNEIAGGKLKEGGTKHWTTPNADATNETGFTALPGGYRSNGGQFYSVENSGYWHTSTAEDATYVWRRDMSHLHARVDRWNNNKRFGFSVRCLQD
jgi:uncharacterized protein (TIGR02145 family)